MQTFEELIKEKTGYENIPQTPIMVDYDDVIDLLKIVRRYTIKECIKVAKNSIYQSADDSFKIGEVGFLQLDGLAVDTSLQAQVILHFKMLAKVNVISAAISGILGVWGAYNGYGVWALIFQYLSNGLVS